MAAVAPSTSCSPPTHHQIGAWNAPDAEVLRQSILLNPEFHCELDRASEQDYEFALRLQFGGSAEEKMPASAVAETENDYAIALSFLEDIPPIRAPADGAVVTVRAQQLDEEYRLTTLSLPIPFDEMKGDVKAEGPVTIEGALYDRRECGSAHGGHTGLCFYMSACAGDGSQAVALKTRLAPTANAISARLRPMALTQFDGVSTMADTEVVMAMVKVDRTPVCVADLDTGRVLLYRDAACTLPTLYVSLGGGHYTRLVRRV